MKVNFVTKGDFKKTERLIDHILDKTYLKALDKYGKKGVELLSEYTPKDTGLTAASWKYTIEKNETGYSLIFSNTNVVKYVNIALILQYGHGTRNGGYVEGIDYINPALKPLFDALADAAWKEVVG